MGAVSIAGLASVAMTVLTVAWFAVFGIPRPEEARDLLMSPFYLVFSQLVFCTFQIAGGSFSAWLSRDRQLFSALGAGLLCSTYSLLQCILAIVQPLPLSGWSAAASIVLPIPACLMGGAVMKRALGLKAPGTK